MKSNSNMHDLVHVQDVVISLEMCKKTQHIHAIILIQKFKNDLPDPPRSIEWLICV